MTSELDDSSDFVKTIVGIHRVYFESKECFDHFLDLASEIPNVFGSMDKNASVTDISVSFRIW